MWYVRYQASKGGYIAARETVDGAIETFGKMCKDRKECEQIVTGLNYGMINPSETEREQFSSLV